MASELCAVEGCGRRALSRKHCMACYQAARRAGTLDALPTPKKRRLSAEQIARIVEAKAAGRQAWQIAVELRITVPAVYRVARRLNAERRKEQAQ